MIPQVQIGELSNYSGSFWRTHLHPDSRDLFRRLRETFLDGAAALKLNTALSRISEGAGIDGGVWQPYDPATSIETSAGYNQWQRAKVDGAWTSLHSSSQEDGTALMPDTLPPSWNAFIPHNIIDSSVFSSPSWLIPIPADIRPIAIACNCWMVAGIDFFAHAGYIEVFKNPDELFGPAGMALLRFESNNKNPTGFAFSSEGRANLNVAYYYRCLQTPETFLKAALTAAGFIQVPEDCTVLAMTATGYITDQGYIGLAYAHQALEPGTMLQRGTFIGARPEIVKLRDIEPRDFPDGLPLQGLIPWGLKVPTGQIKVDIVDGHARPWLNGSYDDLLSFWGFLSRAELVNPEFSLANALSLSDGPHTINWLELLRDNEVDRHIWIVRLNASESEPAMLERLRSFLLRERPLGKSVLFANESPLQNSSLT